MKENKSTYTKCVDMFYKELFAGDFVDVQSSGTHQIYQKADGQLYFSPYGKEERVSSYFSNDLLKAE